MWLHHVRDTSRSFIFHIDSLYAQSIQEPGHSASTLDSRGAWLMPHGDESRLRAVVETVVDGVILIDLEGRVQMFNPACEKLFGYRTEEVIGRHFNLMLPSPYIGAHGKLLA